MTKSLNSLAPSALTDAIHVVRARYHAAGLSDWDIGNGDCENFAHDVLELWAGADWIHLEGRSPESFVTMEAFSYSSEMECWDWALIDKLLGDAAPTADERADWDVVIEQFFLAHVWIEFQGKAYDVEHPEGVSSFFQLNFFQRYLAEARKAPS